MEIGTTEAARRAKLTPGRIRHFISGGLLPARKVGDTWLIQEKDLVKLKGRRGVGRPKKKAAKSNGR